MDTIDLYMALKGTSLEDLEMVWRMRWKALLEERLKEVKRRRGKCEFCEGEDSLVRHHWHDVEGNYQAAWVCQSCNASLTRVCGLARLFGGLPSRELQRLYIWVLRSMKYVPPPKEIWGRGRKRDREWLPRGDVVFEDKPLLEEFYKKCGEELGRQLTEIERRGVTVGFK